MKTPTNIIFKNFAASFLAGGSIWAISPVVTGMVEPWDAESLYYFLSLVTTGLILGLWSPKRIWAHYLGAIFGQLAYLLMFVGASPFILLGVLFLMGYTLLVLMGAFAGSWARSRRFSD